MPQMKHAAPLPDDKAPLPQLQLCLNLQVCVQGWGEGGGRWRGCGYVSHSSPQLPPPRLPIPFPPQQMPPPPQVILRLHLLAAQVCVQGWGGCGYVSHSFRSSQRPRVRASTRRPIWRPKQPRLPSRQQPGTQSHSNSTVARCTLGKRWRPFLRSQNEAHDM